MSGRNARATKLYGGTSGLDGMHRRLVALALLVLILLPSALAVRPPGSFPTGGRDPCVDPGALGGDPQYLIVIDGDCTFRAYVKVTRTTEGTTVELFVETQYGYVHLVLECVDPRYAPVSPFPNSDPKRPACHLGDGLT